MIIESMVGMQLLTAATTLSSGKAVPLSASSLKSKFGFTLKADPANDDRVYVGGCNVSPTVGYPLAPGETVTLLIEDLANIFAQEGSGTQKVRALGVS